MRRFVFAAAALAALTGAAAAQPKHRMCAPMPPDAKNALPDPPGFSLTSVNAKVWHDRKALRVRFLNGDDVLRAQVERFAKMWDDFANMRFHFGTDANAEIRVEFSDDGFSWSKLG